MKCGANQDKANRRVAVKSGFLRFLIFGFKNKGRLNSKNLNERPPAGQRKHRLSAEGRIQNQVLVARSSFYSIQSCSVVVSKNGL